MTLAHNVVDRFVTNAGDAETRSDEDRLRCNTNSGMEGDSALPDSDKVTNFASKLLLKQYFTYTNSS